MNSARDEYIQKRGFQLYVDFYKEANQLVSRFSLVAKIVLFVSACLAGYIGMSWLQLIGIMLMIIAIMIFGKLAIFMSYANISKKQAAEEYDQHRTVNL
jgi:hypothetical protein